MSKLKVSGNASGTGVITLEAPNTNTDRAITLPDSAGELINIAPSTSGNVLTSDGTNWTSAAAGGKVLQVVHATDSTYTTSSSTSYTDTSLSASITPATGSKVLIFVSQNAGVQTSNGFDLKILRGATTVHEFLYFCYGTSIEFQGQYACQALDASPGGDGSTSITYKTQFKTRDSGDNAVLNGQTADSAITLMEIGA